MLLAAYAIAALAFYHLGEIAPRKSTRPERRRAGVPNNPPARYLCVGTIGFPGVPGLPANRRFKPRQAMSER